MWQNGHTKNVHHLFVFLTVVFAENMICCLVQTECILSHYCIALHLTNLVKMAGPTTYTDDLKVHSCIKLVFNVLLL